MQRLDYAQSSPANYQKLLDWHLAVKTSSIDPALRELVLIRCSQINQCLFCIDLHTKDARKAGETERRLYALNAWRKAPFFNDREKAGLEWEESLTSLSRSALTDDLYRRVKEHFTDKELTDLTMLICAINSWNRLGVAFQTQAKD